MPLSVSLSLGGGGSTRGVGKKDPFRHPRCPSELNLRRAEVRTPPPGRTFELCMERLRGTAEWRREVGVDALTEAEARIPPPPLPHHTDC